MCKDNKNWRWKMGWRENDDIQGTISEPLKKQDDRDGRMILCWLEERGVEESWEKDMRKRYR